MKWSFGLMEGLDAPVASLQLSRPQPGFLCGTLPVPTEAGSFGDLVQNQSSAVTVVGHRESNPRYAILPVDTDLNTTPSNWLELGDLNLSCEELCSTWGGSYLTKPIAKKCEALAVTGLAGHGDGIDVIAPVDVLKQIFMMPYSNARLSVLVHRIGRTLILNSGPDVEDGEKIVRRNKGQSNTTERALFSKFVHHSVHCAGASSGSGRNSSMPKQEEESSSPCAESSSGHVSSPEEDGVEAEVVRGDGHVSGARRRQKHTRKVSARRRTAVHHMQTCMGKGPAVSKGEDDERRQEEGGPGNRPNPEGFLRVVFWKFQDLRMLLGTDLLLFSNEEHEAVSLHLLEIERQVTPMMWLNAWLDNVMASVPELAVCYHRQGVVQGYELLKTDDIFLLKGIASDGTAFFSPTTVQKNASSVLQFLQQNCKADPGTYWLLRSAGDDIMQLFDLPVLSESSSMEEGSDKSQLPSNVDKSQFSLPLAMLLFRLAQRLSRPQASGDPRRCAKFFAKCLELLDGKEHPGVRASAHEHVAHIFLNYVNELGPLAEPLLLELTPLSRAMPYRGSQALPAPDADEHGRNSSILALPSGEPAARNTLAHSEAAICLEPVPVLQVMPPPYQQAADSPKHSNNQVCMSETSCASPPSDPQPFAPSAAPPKPSSGFDEPSDLRPPTGTAVGDMSGVEKSLLSFGPQPTLPPPLSSSSAVNAHLVAIHHLSQAVKMLRWQRRMLETSSHSSCGAARCVCGEPDCLQETDDKGNRTDSKQRQLISLLGNTYLGLGQAYRAEGQLALALRAGELAYLVIGSMQQPPTSNNTPSLLDSKSAESASAESHGKRSKKGRGSAKGKRSGHEASGEVDGIGKGVSSTGMPMSEGTQGARPSGERFVGVGEGAFWGRLWMFVGDTYVEVPKNFEGGVPVVPGNTDCGELGISADVVRELKRLRRRSGQTRQSCSTCFKTGCSCLNDRASSGSSTSSSRGGDVWGGVQGRRSMGRRSGIRASEAESSSDGGAVSAGESMRRGLRWKPSDAKTSVDNFGGKVECPGDVVAVGGMASNLGSGDKAEMQAVIEGGSSGQVRSTRAGVAREVWAEQTCFGRPMTSDWEANLTAAVQCYKAAAAALVGAPELAVEREAAIRRCGWACNELGRRHLSAGRSSDAEAVFQSAVAAFREVCDTTNVVLVFCNLGHSRRAAAEALAAELAQSRAATLSPPSPATTRLKLSRALQLYGEALGFYCNARTELLAGAAEPDPTISNSRMAATPTSGCHTSSASTANDSTSCPTGPAVVAEGATASRPAGGGIWTEVATQLGHTYLRLGMLLKAEGWPAGEDASVEPATAVTLLGAGGGSLRGVRCEEESRSIARYFQGEASAGVGKRAWDHDAMTPKEAMAKALALYESLGDVRVQEAAYTHYELACYHRDCAVESLQGGGSRGGGGRGGAGGDCHQAVRRYAALAEVHLQKALRFYRPETHPDMFVNIAMERATLANATASTAHPNTVSDIALAHLLEARLAYEACSRKGVAAGSSRTRRGPTDMPASADIVAAASPQVSPAVSARFMQQLQTLLRRMLAAAMSSGNSKQQQVHNAGHEQGSSTTSRLTADSKGTCRGGADSTLLRTMFREALLMGQCKGQDHQHHLDSLLKLHNMWVGSQ